MAATRPIRVTDLVKKYGWEILIYLNNLGIRNLAECQVLFVDSNATNALDADDGYHGHSLINPLATWDYAVGLCTAGESSVILLAPRHNDSLGDAQIDLDVTDVHTIGMGSGALKPRVDFDHANSSVLFGANNNTIQNIDFLPAITDILIGVEFETGVTGCKMKDCRFLIGEDGAGVDEFIEAIKMTSGNDDTEFENVLILAHASAVGATHGINVAAAADRVTYRNVIIDGPYATGGIVEAAAGVNLICEGCSIDVSGTNFSFDGSSTFAKRTNNVDAGVDSEEDEPLITVARGVGNYPTGITDNSILAYIMGKGGTASASTFVNTDDSLEAISDKITAIDNTVNLNTAVADTPTAKSLHDILSELDGANTYDNTTDSLEAISNFVRTGVTLGAGINLDHLMKTVVVDKQDMDAEVAQGSVLSHICTKTDGDMDDFDPTTDSLEAIADAVTGFTTAVSATPTARSVQDILEKDDQSGFDDATDSLQAISDKAGAFDMTGSGQAGSVKASLDLAHTDIDAILADTLSISGGALPADPTSDSLAAFIASGGTQLGQELPDSMSLIDLIGNYTGAYDDAEANDNIKAHLDLIKTDVNTNITSIGTISNAGGTAALGAALGPFANVTLVARLDLVQTEVDKIGTIVNTAGVATIGGIFGDFANSSLVARLGNLQTGATSIGTIVNTAGAANLGALLGDFANVSMVTKLTNLQTDATKIGTIVNTAGTATIGGIFGDFANSTLVSRLDTITTDTAAIDPGAKRLATRTLMNWELTAANDLWTVSAPVKAKIWGVVLAAVNAVATNLKISSTPTAPGGLVDIAANLDCDGDAIGTVYKMNTTLGGALVATTAGVCIDDAIEVILPAGVVQMGSGTDEEGGGSIQWFCEYTPLVAGATVSNT